MARLAGTLALQASHLRVLYVGRLSAAKHVDTAIRACARVRTDRVRVTLTIAGEGAERQPLEALAASLPGPDDVRFTGGLDFAAVLELYASHNVLVLASETEGWPKAIAEALAFGLVCIGPARSVVPQMLADGRGFVVEPGDVSGVEQALRRLLAWTPQQWADAAAKAAAWGQRFTLENVREAVRKQLAARHWL